MPQFATKFTIDVKDKEQAGAVFNAVGKLLQVATPSQIITLGKKATPSLISKAVMAINTGLIK